MGSDLGLVYMLGSFLQVCGNLYNDIRKLDSQGIHIIIHESDKSISDNQSSTKYLLFG